MALIPLTDMIGQVGAFIPAGEINVDTIPSGSSGTIKTVTATGGNVIRITSLYTAGAAGENNITFAIENNDGTQNIITNAQLSDVSPTSAFYVGNLSAATLDGSRYGLIFVDCAGFSVIKTTGTTSNDINVTYIEGRIE